MNTYKVTYITDFKEGNGIRIEASNAEVAARRCLQQEMGLKEVILTPYNGDNYDKGVVFVSDGVSPKGKKVYKYSISFDGTDYTNGQSLESALKNMKDDMVDLTLYGTTDRISRKTAIVQMIQWGAGGSGAECERYSSALVQLLLGYTRVEA